MVRHPHTIYRLRTSETGPDSGGNYAASTGQWVPMGQCREQVAGSGDSLVVDGKDYAFRSVVHLSGPMAVRAGNTVQVRNPGGGIRIEGTVLRYDAGQISARLWL